MLKLLWLDDYRDPFDKEIDWMIFSPIGRDVEIHWVLSYLEFVQWIKQHGLPDAICFDHDLGGDIKQNLIKQGYSKRKAKEIRKNMELPNGYDCAKWLVDYCLDNNLNIPAFNIQSANPVGKENIQKLLESFNKFN